IKDFMFAEAARGGAILAGLEHLDDRYLKAVGYATKSRSGGAVGNGRGLPKMVLVGDIVGDDADAVARATSEVVRIANSRAGEGFVAVSADARKKFWLDRKRTAAIAKHTNAFKINEDVVIPLPRMGEYTEGIERINIELSLRNKLQLLDALENFFTAGNLPLGKTDDANVHTNIPVNSDNYEMLQTAHEAVARIMKLARSLDGVISGEHGIGITKLEFLTDDELRDFSEYKAKVDPEGRFNKGKLLRD